MQEEFWCQKLIEVHAPSNHEYRLEAFQVAFIAQVVHIGVQCRSMTVIHEKDL